MKKNIMRIQIRTCEKNDYEAICDLIRDELGYAELNVANTYKRFNIMQDNPSYQIFVAVYNNTVVGFIGLFRGIAFNVDGEYLQVIALAVKKEYQNKGIGTQLLVMAEQYAQDENIITIGLNSGLHREKAHEFYEGRGYIKKSYSFIKSL